MTELRQRAHELIDGFSDIQLAVVIDFLSKAKQDDDINERLKIARSLYGIIPPDITLEESREERLSKI